MSTEAYAYHEFKRFLRAIGFESVYDKDHQHAVADLAGLIEQMKATAQKRGMSEDEIATIYSADDLIDLYRETRMKRH